MCRYGNFAWVVLGSIGWLLPAAALGQDGPGQKPDRPVAAAEARAVGRDGLTIEGEITSKAPKRRFNNSNREMHADHHLIRLNAGIRYLFTLDKKRPGLDPYLVLEDEKGAILAFDDDGGGTLNSRLVYTIGKSGTYRVTAAAFDGMGPYVLRIVEEPVVPLTVPREGLVLKGAVAPGDPKTRVGQHDLRSKLYDVRLEAGVPYTMTLDASEVGLDPYLIVRDAAGTLLASDDDSGGFYNAKLTFTPAETGNYKVSAAAFRGTGKFGLRIAAPGADRRTVATGGLNLEGEVHADDPRVNFKGMPHPMPAKVFEVELRKGRHYVANLHAKKVGLDPFLALQGPDGEVIGLDNDGGGFPHALLKFQAQADGVYKIHTAAFSGSGPFSLSVSEVSSSATVNVLRQGFPAGKSDPANLEASETAWEIEWSVGPFDGVKQSSTLLIRSARYMFKDKEGRPRWFTVLKNLTAGEMFVPYNTGSPQYLDIAAFQFGLVTLKPEHLGPTCVAPGEILDSPVPAMKHKVAREIHDDGIRWVNGQDNVRRGERMNLWSILSAGNYRYVQEYGFGDDGSIVCRMGATAHNLVNLPDTIDKAVHLHLGCWRWDPELAEDGSEPIGGSAKNRVLMVRRLPTPMSPGKFVTDISPFNSQNGSAMEGFEDWRAEEFPTLRVQSVERKNGSGRSAFTAYDLVPLRMGNARGFGDKHEFANHDFWVTHRRDRQSYYRDVPKYVQNQKLDGSPVTVWHASGLMHVPRGEDFGPDGVTARQGVALNGWVGFVLKPVNLFDSTPLYPLPTRPAVKK